MKEENGRMEKTPSNNLRARDSALDGVKGIAILLVMVGHCIVLNGLSTSDPYLYDAIKSVQMPLFMLLSGIAAGSGLLLPGKLPRRLRAWVLPFFTWFVISYFLARIRDRLAGKPIVLSAGDFAKELKALLFQTDRGLWFLMTLFVITAVMTLAAFLAGKLFSKASAAFAAEAVLALLLWGCFILQQRAGFALLSPSLTVAYMPYYCLGYFGKRLFSAQGADRWRRLFVPAAAVLFVLFLFLVIRYPLCDPVEGLSSLLLQQAASLTGTVSVFGLSYALLSAAGNAKKGSRALVWIGQYTLEIYVLHFRFARLLRLSEKGLFLYTPKGLFWLLAAFLLMSVLTALCILLLKRVRVLDLLLFGKRKEG